MQEALSSLTAPAAWRAIDFVSDVHLQAAAAATEAAWQHYLQHSSADALFILGDLFELWVGDDALHEHGFERRCAAALRQAGLRLALYFMVGNRDFLAGPAFAAQARLTLLSDPTLLRAGDQCYLLSHGDAWCQADLAYQSFRSQVRSPAWQRDFLARPLAQRRALAQQLRWQSQAHQRQQPVQADVDDDLTRAGLRAAAAGVLIHGHTHRPAQHPLGDGLRREVLSDWDAESDPPRLQVLRLQLRGPRTGLQRLSLSAGGDDPAGCRR